MGVFGAVAPHLTWLLIQSLMCSVCMMVEHGAAIVRASLLWMLLESSLSVPNLKA